MEDVITIDGAGRLVVPKALRTKFDLREGRKLVIRDDGARLVLEPIADDARPVEVDGLLVIRGRLTGDVPDHRALRSERIQALATRK